MSASNYAKTASHERAFMFLYGDCLWTRETRETCFSSFMKRQWNETIIEERKQWERVRKVAYLKFYSHEFLKYQDQN